MKKQSLIAVSVIAAISVGLYFYQLNDNNISESQVASKINMNKPVSVDIKPEKKYLKNNESLQKKQLSSEVQIDNVEPSYVDSLMFVSSKEAEDVLKASGKLRENLEGEVYLNINAQELLSLNTGDTFRLDIPELDMFYDIEVSNAYEDQFGNKTIEANLPDQDMTYSSVLTINERAIYANIATPDGIYVMQGNGQYAWMAETNDLSRGVIMDSFENNTADNSNVHDHQEVTQPMISGTHKEIMNTQ
ncbi:hypothetical protein [uncultured Shewanella sp.]|uniref:hypothetical protein n=1 Tax=uncultured Shewanella sp. TaxID=173975 RepID=UPI0026086281|nr:hypothetical protein [uncultured Shewanella sp.]